MFDNKTEKEAREEILQGVREYWEIYHKKRRPFKKGDKIHYSGRVCDSTEMIYSVDACLTGFLTSSEYNTMFEKGFSKLLGVKYCSTVNSGSSANLVAFSALTSPTLGKRAIKRGDEVITVAAGFPTTITPCIQYGAEPVFVDITIPQYNIDVAKLENAVSEKTKAVMIAHTLGNPFDLRAVKQFCDKYNLWLIEDNCDALGSKYVLNGEYRYTGTVGDIGTSSFYPPHHITMGEGGAVYTNNPQLHKIMRSLRDWGRDCQCPSGVDNFCGHRFDGQYGELPPGFDHKYIYSNFGFNFKITDIQAAIGCGQLLKVHNFINARRANFNYILRGLQDLEDKIILPKPCENAFPSWFGFMITCRDGISRNKVVNYLENSGVQTRNLFAGNIIKHPCFDEMRKAQEGYRVVGTLENTDRVMNNSFWIGVYPGLEPLAIDYMIEKVHEALR